MKIFLRVISPKIPKSISNEFTIEEKLDTLSLPALINCLKKQNMELYTELSQDGNLHPNYVYIVNKELLSYSQGKDYLLYDQDHVTISFAIGGG